MRRAVRTANCSCFYGDAAAAALEVVEGGPIDIPLDLLALDRSGAAGACRAAGWEDCRRG